MAQVAADQPHHRNCNQAQNRDSGLAEDGNIFRERYNIDVPFNLECVGCCFAFLRRRNYLVVQGPTYDRVCYSSQNLAVPGAVIRADLVNSFVRAPNRRGRRGQIATGYDYNLGNRVVRPFANSRTYQIYSYEAKVLSVGFLARARMESVAIEAVRPEELVEIYFNYADAALVELYREDHGLPPLSRPEATGYLLLRSSSQNNRT